MPARRRYEDAIPAIPPAPPLSRPERHLRIALLAGALLFAVEAAIYVPEVFGGPPDTRPFGINSVAKDVLFAALTALAAVNLPHRGEGQPPAHSHGAGAACGVGVHHLSHRPQPAHR
jgi:hypothetical protein